MKKIRTKELAMALGMAGWVFALAPLAANAGPVPDISAITFNFDEVRFSYDGTESSGMVFKVTKSIDVTHLGKYDTNGNNALDDLAINHNPNMRLYRYIDPGTGVLLAQVNLTGAPDTLRDHFFWGELASPVTLDPGNYMVAGDFYYLGEPIQFFERYDAQHNWTWTTIPEIELYDPEGGSQWNRSRVGRLGVYPDRIEEPHGYPTGVNLGLTPSVAPEPATLALLGFGAVALVLRRRRK